MLNHDGPIAENGLALECLNFLGEPQPESGGRGLGLPSSGRRAINAQLRAFRTAGLSLSRGREADVWRADDAVLLHLRLQII